VAKQPCPLPPFPPSAPPGACAPQAWRPGCESSPGRPRQNCHPERSDGAAGAQSNGSRLAVLAEPRRKGDSLAERSRTGRRPF